MKKIIYTSAFKRDVKRMKKREKIFKKLEEVLLILQVDKKLPEKYFNHKLKGECSGCWECHIEPDWLLIYRKYLEEIEVLELVRTGSHSDLF